MDATGRSKRVVIAALVVCFFAQSALVYSDGTETRSMPPEAVAGRRVWHRSNCQACHQLYGMGGFLGPDLTNAASRVPEQRIRTLLRYGYAQMPAFDLAEREVDEVVAFLRFIDSTGQGQVGPGEGLPWWTYRE